MVTDLAVSKIEDVQLLCERIMTSPVEGCLGLRLAGSRPDSLTLRMPIPAAEAAHRREVGLVTVLAVLADVAGGLSVVVLQSAGLGAPTVELRIDHAGPPAPEARELLAEATVSHTGPGVAYSMITVRDDTGRLVARGQGHYVRNEGRDDNRPASIDKGAPIDNIPGGPIAVDDEDRDRPEALLDDLAPLLPDTVPDPAEWRLPVTTRMANARRQVQGGVLLAIGQLAQRRVQLADGGEARPLSVQVEYLRPAPIEDPELTVRTGYVRRGRRFRTLRTELVRADGRIATSITGLWLLGAGEWNESQATGDANGSLIASNG